MTDLPACYKKNFILLMQLFTILSMDFLFLGQQSVAEVGCVLCCKLSAGSTELQGALMKQPQTEEEELVEGLALKLCGQIVKTVPRSTQMYWALKSVQ